MLTALLSILVLIQVPDTLDASVVRAPRHVSPPSEKATREVLERAANLADAIRDFSGVQLRDYGGTGGLKTVNVRSLGSAHTAIFLDGVPIDNAQNMQPDLGRLDVQDFETVELYSGGKSNLLQSAREYGSASSIHMTTAVPRKRQTTLEVSGGSFRTLSASAGLEGRLGDLISGRLRIGGETSDGRYPYRVTGPAYDNVMIRENSDIKAFKASGGLWFAPEGGNYHLGFRLYDSERGIPGPVYKQSPSYPMSLDRQADRAFSIQASGTQELSPRLSLLARARYSRDILQYLDVSEISPTVSARWDYDLQSAYLSASLGWQALPWLYLNCALDCQTEKLESRVDVSRNTLLGAVATTVLKDPWRASASLQYMVSDDGYRFLSPSVIVDWHPRTDWEFGAVVKRSCRLPSFNDLYYTNVSSRNLLPEQAWQISARWCWDRSYGPWHFRTWEELYHNYVLDKLVAVPGGSLFRWSMYNMGTVLIWGDELCANVTYSDYGGISARYSFQRAYEKGSAEQIPYIPLHSASFTLFAGVPSFHVYLKGFVAGQRRSSRSARPEYLLAPWTTWDITAQWCVSPRLRVSLDVRNILNRQYEIVLKYPMPGINVLGRVAFKL